MTGLAPFRAFSCRVHRVLVSLCLGLLASAAAPPAALGRPLAAPVVDLEALLVGAQAGIGTASYDTRVAAGVGWGFETQRIHWRLQAAVPLGLSGAARLGYQDWPDPHLLGQARARGFEGAFE